MIVRVLMEIDTDDEQFENSWVQDTDLAHTIAHAIWLYHKPFQGDGFDYTVELKEPPVMINGHGKEITQ